MGVVVVVVFCLGLLRCGGAVYICTCAVELSIIADNLRCSDRCSALAVIWYGTAMLWHSTVQRCCGMAPCSTVVAWNGSAVLWHGTVQHCCGLIRYIIIVAWYSKTLSWYGTMQLCCGIVRYIAIVAC